METSNSSKVVDTQEVELDIFNSSGSIESQNGEDILTEELRFPPPQNPLQRPIRERRAPNRYSPSNYYLLLTDGGERECYAEAE